MMSIVNRKGIISVSFLALAAVICLMVFGFSQASAEELEKTAAGLPTEGKLEAFMGEPKFDIQRLYGGGRFPIVVVATDGTVLALWGNGTLRRSEDGGKKWGRAILIGRGSVGGGAIVNEVNGDILAFIDAPGRNKSGYLPTTIYVSKDHGKTWTATKPNIEADMLAHVPMMCINEAGITLRHGKHIGRLIRAARHYGYGPGPRPQCRHERCYTTAIYSGDGGKTWRRSKPFAATGTGEAAIAELSDGTLYYNSRCFWTGDPEKPPRKRRCAWSDDGGASWRDWQIIPILPDGPQDMNYGNFAGLTRLPVRGKDILLFSNNDVGGRERIRGTVWASFDGGKTWPIKRLVYKGYFSYSSLEAGRPGTRSEGWIYVNFESKSPGVRSFHLSEMARFNLSWLLKGEKTGDGEVPKWLSE